MELLIVAPAPVVADHAAVLRDLFENQCQFRHVQHDLTGLIVLSNENMASIAHCILESAYKIYLSRLLAEAPWQGDSVNHHRIRFMLQQTRCHRHRRRESLPVIEDALCAHVGILFDYVDRHDLHSNGTYPLAHHPVTSLSVSGPIRVPPGLRLCRRYEGPTHWEATVAMYCPDIPIPRENKARNRLYQQLDPVLLQEPQFRARHEQVRTAIALAVELIEEASRYKVPFGLVTFDAWYLGEDSVRALAGRRKDWISLLITDRLLEAASVQLKDVNSWAMKRPCHHIAVEDLVPLIPVNAYRPVKVQEHTYGCFTLAVRISVSFETGRFTGRSVVQVSSKVEQKDRAGSRELVRYWDSNRYEPHTQPCWGLMAYRRLEMDR